MANAIGNHDKDNENFYNHFSVPNSTHFGKTKAGGDYYFTYGNTLFLFLNTNNLNMNDHKEFIKSTIKKNQDIKWKILYKEIFLIKDIFLKYMMLDILFQEVQILY